VLDLEWRVEEAKLLWALGRPELALRAANGLLMQVIRSVCKRIRSTAACLTNLKQTQACNPSSAFPGSHDAY